MAALHDIGKFNSGFQKKGFPGPTPTAGHVNEVLALLGDSPFSEQGRLLAALPETALKTWSPDYGAFQLLVAAIGHHGRPAEIEESRYRAVHWKPHMERDPFDGIAELTDLIERWYPSAFEATKDILPSAPAFQHAFAGLVMLADWLGSDTRFFPYSKTIGDRIQFARQQATRALSCGWIAPGAARAVLGADPPGFDSVSPHPPRSIQRAIIDLPVTKQAASLALLEAETGSGKTEAALAHFLRLFHQGEVDGIYFALPTRTAATQIHQRVIDSIARAFPDQERRPPVILAVPGYLRVDGHEGRALPHFKVLWNDNPREQLRYRSWAAEHPKRYLAGTIVVGTIDQVLLSTLMVGHAHMRSTALLRHLLVADEVHASDPYMVRLLSSVLDNHLAAGGHALLMSATLGSVARRKFFSVPQEAPSTASLENEIAMNYPLLTVKRGSAKPFVVTCPSEETGKEVARELHTWMQRSDKVVAAALTAAARGARVLILRNTVTDCVDTLLELENTAATSGTTDLLFRCAGQVAPHHARYSKEDRQALDAALENRLAATTPGQGIVVVGTQTIQQSLDIDFDLLLTDLCPMDVMLQRIGRLHRHEKTRPHGFEKPTVLVLVPEERDLALRISTRDGSPSGKNGIGTVYDDLRVIEATWRCLEKYEQLNIPVMNRRLVESTTHPEALATITAGQEIWTQHGAYVAGTGAAETRLAGLNVIDRNRAFGEVGIAFPSGNGTRRIPTRLGENDRIVEFAPSVRSAFGNEFSRLTIPAWLSRKIAPEAEVLVTEIESSGMRFKFGEFTFRYDRLGLRQLAENASGGATANG